MGIMLEGIVAIYKEEGMTSHDVVDAVRQLTGEKRVGHAGTLDPCAKGVLVIGVGRAATKTLSLVAGAEKEYVTRVKLGWRSTTEDREGQIEQVFWTTEGQAPCLPWRRATTGSGSQTRYVAFGSGCPYRPGPHRRASPPDARRGFWA